MFAPLIEESKGFKNLKKLIIDSNLCSFCGSCGIMCENINYEDIPFLTENKPCIITNGAQICGIQGCCFDNCPMTSFSKKDYERVFFGKTNSDPDLGSYRKILSGRSTSKEILNKAQNGGTVTSLLTYALSADLNGSKYAGAIVTKGGDGWQPKPCFVSRPEELYHCMGSIYSCHPLSRQIRNLLREKLNLIFVGTGCQTTGIRKYQYNFLRKVPPETTRIFLIGLFCYENFAYHQFINVLQEKSKMAIENISKMDIIKGKLIIYSKNGSVLQYPIKEFSPLVSEACKICTNFTAELTDISVGAIGSKEGWNTIIIRTEEGLELIERLESKSILETTTKVSLEEIKKTVNRKRILSEKIKEKRRTNAQYVPNFD
ncbi:MAG: Coenzyme F420 hydrogenase/dehydrogenase, beta subunit C-terminal domain [Promethearchaeota archaeon]